MIAQEDRPPYVTFETRAMEDRDASIKAGHWVGKDVDFALITPMGTKERVERVVEDWFTQLDAYVREEPPRFNPVWLGQYKQMYQAWKSGQAIPVNGTPIKHWPALSPSENRAVISANCLTIEDLSQANEETLRRIGMGARALKERAKSWLENADKGQASAKIAALQAELSDKDVTIASLAARLEKLEKASA